MTLRLGSLVHRGLLLLALCPPHLQAAAAQEATQPTPLALGSVVEREIKGGETHRYTIALDAGALLDAVVLQRGVDVAVSLVGPDGAPVLEVDSPNGENGPEPVLIVAERGGAYTLEVKALDPATHGGPYEARIVAIRAATPKDRDLAGARKQAGLADMLASAGKLRDAVEPANRAVRLFESALGAEHPDTAAALDNLASLYAQSGLFAEAEPGFVRALAIREKALGPDDPLTATSLNSLALLYQEQGHLAKAEPLYLRALAVRERRLGPEHPLTASVLDNLAGLYRLQGKLEMAEPLYLRALAIREKALGPEHVMTASSLNNVALLYREQGQYAKAETYYVRALAIYERMVGPDHAFTATALDNLAALYVDQAKYTKAEPHLLRSLAIREKAIGPEHPETAFAVNNLAVLYRSAGQYAKAEPLYLRALAIREKALGPENPLTAVSVGNLGTLYAAQGQFAKAEPQLLRALAIFEKALGPEHPQTAAALANVAQLFTTQGLYEKAEPRAVRAVALYEKSLGPEHRMTAVALNNLALIYSNLGQYAKAEPLYLRSLAIREKALGLDHPSTANALNNLAILYFEAGQYAKSESYFVRSLAIRERALGLQHPDTAISLDNLAGLYTATEAYARAIETQARANDVRERELQLNLVSGSEREKLLYLQLSADELDRTLSLHTRHAPADPAARRAALEIVLRRKGRSLDAMALQIEALRARATPEDARLLDELAAVRSEQSRSILAGPGRDGVEVHRARLAELESTVDRLQAEISRRSLEFAVETRPIALDAVRERIPDDARLVEFAVFRPYDAKLQRFGEPRYVVYVVGRAGEIGWADLGEAHPIDALVANFRKRLRSKDSSVEASLGPLARQLDARVMEPVRRIAGATTRLLVSPDGALNLVPFAALVDENGEYLVERYQIQYLTSGRDLLRLVDRPAGATAMIVADPDFGTGAAGTERSLEHADGGSGGSDADALAGATFTALPGTADEAEELSRLMTATVLTQGAATERALKAVAAPRILHVATHGYFLADTLPSSESKRRERLLVQQEAAPGASAAAAARLDPLLRSGLGLAGANLRSSGDGEDGLLTAREAAGLNLWGTRLVVLSACDTGVGEVRTGEGVYGLRRALVLAGAETTMVSLWPVSDKGTRDLMIEFYELLFEGESRAEALRQVQLEMLHSHKYRHPFFWASFVQSGAWGPIAQ